MSRKFPEHVIKQDTHEVCLHWYSFCNWLRLHGCALDGWPDMYDDGLFDIDGILYCNHRWVQAGWYKLGQAYAHSARKELENVLIVHRWLINDLDFVYVKSPERTVEGIEIGFDGASFWLSDNFEDKNIYAHYEQIRTLFRSLVPHTTLPASHYIETMKPTLPFGLGISKTGYIVQKDCLIYLLSEIRYHQCERSAYIRLIVKTALDLLKRDLEQRNVIKRPTLDEYYMNLAHAAKVRATCKLKQVGAVLVKNNQVIATGYNGSLPGAYECDAMIMSSDSDLVVTCGKKCQITRTRSNGKTTSACNTIHAEVNAIFQCINRGLSVEGATLYVTFAPCIDCCKIAALSGISRIVFDEPNGYTETHKHFQDFVNIEQINEKDGLKAELVAKITALI